MKLTKLLLRAVKKLKSFKNRDKLQIGYENPKLLMSIKEKTALYLNEIAAGEIGAESFRILAAIGLLPRKPELNIIDFGGSYGIHYAAAHKCFPSVNFKWVVIETPGLVSSVSKEKNTSGLFYTSSLASATLFAGKFDLIFANSSIHYSADPINKLNEIVNLEADYIFITRTPLTNLRHPINILQESRLTSNGPGKNRNIEDDTYVTYPCTILNKQDFESVLLSKYRILLSFNEEVVSFTRAGLKFQNYGYFCHSLKLISSDRNI